MWSTQIDMFSTPVWEAKSNYGDSFNEELLKEIEFYYKNNTTNPKDSNIWLSDTPCIEQLKKDTLSIVSRCTFKYLYNEYEQFDYYHTRGWLNRLKPGQHLPLHGHGSSRISLTYYINAPESCGDLILVDPRGGVNWEKGNDGVMGTKYNRIKPTTGSLVFFPSFVLHSVDYNQSNQERISVTTDIVTISKADVDYLKTIA